MLSFLAPVIYVQLSPTRLTVRNARTGESISEVPEIAITREPKAKVAAVGSEAQSHKSNASVQVFNPFAHPRTLIGDFTFGEQSVEADLRGGEIRDRTFQTEADYAVIDDAYRRAARIVSPDIARTFTETLAKRKSDSEEDFEGALIEAREDTIPRADQKVARRSAGSLSPDHRVEPEAARRGPRQTPRRGSKPRPCASRTELEVSIVRPDFLFFGESKDGSVTVDIVDPHGTHLADALPKLRGLARYAETHPGVYRRIEVVAEAGGKWRVLDLTRADVRKAIAEAGDAESIYEGALGGDYGR